jgi:hypothetical protein
MRPRYLKVKRFNYKIDSRFLLHEPPRFNDLIGLKHSNNLTKLFAFITRLGNKLDRSSLASL